MLGTPRKCRESISRETAYIDLPLQVVVSSLSPAARSERMSRFGHQDTKPEKRVRQVLAALGFRNRLQGLLPGRPDIVVPRRRKVVFVHGCLWHRHQGCGRLPKSRLDF